MTRTELLSQIFSLSSDDQRIIAEAVRNHLARSFLSVDEVELKSQLQRRVTDADQNSATNPRSI